MKLKLLFAATLCVAALGACSREASTPPPEAASTEAPMTPPAILVEDTPTFVQKVALSDMYEIQAARIVIERSPTAAIKSFARTMVTDHTASTQRLTAALAAQTGAPPLPTTLDDDHLAKLQALRDATPADLDVRYVDQQTEAHEDALALLQRYAQGGDNAALQAFAADTATKVQHHLDMVRGLDQSGADRQAEHTQ
jgi:putative membrane protein